MKELSNSTVFIMLFVLQCSTLWSQNHISHHDSKFQYGFSAKIVADISSSIDKFNIRGSILI